MYVEIQLYLQHYKVCSIITGVFNQWAYWWTSLRAYLADNEKYKQLSPFG